MIPPRNFVERFVEFAPFRVERRGGDCEPEVEDASGSEGPELFTVSVSLDSPTGVLLRLDILTD